MLLEASGKHKNNGEVLMLGLSFGDVKKGTPSTEEGGREGRREEGGREGGGREGYRIHRSCILASLLGGKQ